MTQELIVCQIIFWSLLLYNDYGMVLVAFIYCIYVFVRLNMCHILKAFCFQWRQVYDCLLPVFDYRKHPMWRKYLFTMSSFESTLIKWRYWWKAIRYMWLYHHLCRSYPIDAGSCTCGIDLVMCYEMYLGKHVQTIMMFDNSCKVMPCAQPATLDMSDMEWCSYWLSQIRDPWTLIHSSFCTTSNHVRTSFPPPTWPGSY